MTAARSFAIAVWMVFMAHSAAVAQNPPPTPPAMLSSQPPVEADAAKRGVPHPTKKFGDRSVPTVWETWKSMDELFPADAATNLPTPWDDYEANLALPTKDELGHARLVKLPGLDDATAGHTKLLSRISKLEDINQAGFGTLDFPLVAQNRTFVRYEIRVNQIQYEEMVAKKYYLRSHLPPEGTVVEMPDQSITVKAAWMEIASDHPNPDRFYTVAAKVVDWENGQPVLHDRKVALIGFHVVHRTPLRRNWIWATFEHVDTTDLAPGGTHPPCLCSEDAGVAFGTPGTNVPPPKIEPGQPIPTSPEPVQVARKTPPHATTAAINTAYQNHPEIKNTVWANYRLIVTQWPTPPGDGAVALRFPKENVANATMETYHQGTGCMNCHVLAKPVKYVFYPEFRAVADTTLESDDSGQIEGVAAAMKRVEDILQEQRDKPSE
jgi:hypothetical protein